MGLKKRLRKIRKRAAVPLIALLGLIALTRLSPGRLEQIVGHIPDRPVEDILNDLENLVESPLPEATLNSDQWVVVPDSVYDGDTLRVERGGEELKIRFCGIGAPEKEQPLGIEARDHLRSLIDQGDGSVELIPVETDRYERTVAELFVVRGDGSEVHLNSQMVMDGYAYHYAQYSDSCPNQVAIEEAEAIAQASGVGVWANPASEKPWEWRKQN